jgi:hypothetical protein
MTSHSVRNIRDHQRITTFCNTFTGNVGKRIKFVPDMETDAIIYGKILGGAIKEIRISVKYPPDIRKIEKFPIRLSGDHVTGT